MKNKSPNFEEFSEIIDIAESTTTLKEDLKFMNELLMNTNFILEVLTNPVEDAWNEL